MANICNYKVRVIGKRKNCYAMFGSFPCMDDKFIFEEYGTEEECELLFEGDCKWGIDAYCTHFDGEMPVDVPEDTGLACQAGMDYWYHPLQEKSEMFQVDVYCVSADIEYDPEHIEDYTCREHYVNGQMVDFGEKQKILELDEE